MNIRIRDIPRYADIIAIPFFALAIFIVWRKPEKDNLDYLLLFFFVAAFLADFTFTVLFFTVE